MEADLSVHNSHAVTIEFPAFHMMIKDDLQAKMAEAHFGNKSPIMALVEK